MAQATFKNYFHNEYNNPNNTVSITDYYKGGTERISEIRVLNHEYRFLNGEHFFHTIINLFGNCNGFGGLGLKTIKSNEFQTREEAVTDAWKKVERWLKKNEGLEIVIQ